ncbi:MAG TPA: type II secretion system F family protein [Telluria sp.]|nr:type II secretion system F family protein [Telluria sp.]
MNHILDSEFHLVLSVLVFISVMLLLEGLYLLYRSHYGPLARRVEQRLRSLAGTAAGRQVLRASHLSDSPWIGRLLETVPFARQLDRFVRQAGVGWTVSTLLLATAGSALAAWLVMDELLHQPRLLALAAALAAAAAVPGYLQRRRARRLAALERQLPEALDLLGRALRAGHAFSAGLQMVAEEMPEPLAAEFRFTHEEVSFGVGLDQALSNLAQRVPLTDLRIFVVAVLIQRESGGNLTEVLANLARLIRDRLRLQARVRVLSAEGRLSAWILVLMPFALAALLNAFNPKFMAPLWTDPLGQSMLRLLLTLMLVGVILLKKITRVRV